MAKTMRCACNPSNYVAYIVLLTIGFWALVQGFILQWNYAGPLVVAPWYFLGFLMFGMGRLLKKQACAACPVHGWVK